MGYAGNVEPQYIVPTVIACKADEGGIQGKRDGVEDLDFFIGDAAFANSTTHQINYPIRHGLVDNWDNMVYYCLLLIIASPIYMSNYHPLFISLIGAPMAKMSIRVFKV